jgi:4-hydroxy-tetrahydrodipicolinate synthase
MYTGFGTIITAAVTPFDASGEVDLEAFRALLRHLAVSGSDAVVVTGTTGESPTLHDDEKVLLWRTAVEELAGTIPVIAGTGSNDTMHSAELTRRACDAGVDGVLVVTPYYNKPPRDGLLRHFSTVARASSVPVILYNIPGRVVINLDPDLVAELARIDNVVALKQAQPNLDELRSIRKLAPDLAIYAGDDDAYLPMLLEGAVGVISVASHIIGPQMAQLAELVRCGDIESARTLGQSLDDVFETLAITSNPIPIKAALNQLGISVGGLRLPLVEASGMQVERIRAMLARHELVTAPA